jgi:hypothetical protein
MIFESENGREDIKIKLGKKKEKVPRFSGAFGGWRCELYYNLKSKLLLIATLNFVF